MTETEGTIRLTWPARPGAVAYRVVVRDDAIGQIVLRAPAAGPECALSTVELDPGHPYRWKAQCRPDRATPWTDLTEYLRLCLPPRDAAMGIRLEWLAAPGEWTLYRVVVRDETEGRVFSRDPTYETRFVVDGSRLTPGHVYRWCVQVREGAAWRRHTPYRSVDQPVQLLLAAREPPTSRAAEGERLLFLFTVDTEVNLRLMREPDPARGVEHQVFCRCDGREYGINLMMDLLERHGFRGTFFLDILMEYQFGQKAVEEIIAAIKTRGHDIQLHLHSYPHFWYARDPRLQALNAGTSGKDTRVFRQALEHAIGLFERRMGCRPIAFRNGSYHFNDGLFSVLGEAGIRIDSSLYAFKNCRVSPWMRVRTQPFRVHGVLEIPVSWMIHRKADGTSVQQFAIKRTDMASNVTLRTVGGDANGYCDTLVFMAHSYTLLKEIRSRDPALVRQWNRRLQSFCPPTGYGDLSIGEDTPLISLEGPDENRVSFLGRILDAVASMPGVRVLTFQELHDLHSDRWERPSSAVDAVPVWHREARRATLTGTRRYSQSYLGYCERSAAGSSSSADVDPGASGRGGCAPPPPRQTATAPTGETCDPVKLTLEWGERQAEALYRNTLARFDVPLRGATTLDFGCAWGYFAKYLLDRLGAGLSCGVDLIPQWTMMRPEESPLGTPNLRLYAGRLQRIAELQDMTFDFIFSAGTFMLIEPTALREILDWFYDHLRPGGLCVFRTRTFLSYCGGDLHRKLRTPMPHLLFPKRIIDAYLVERGVQAPRYMSPLCAASYLTLYHRAGFEIVRCERSRNPLDEGTRREARAKLRIYDELELNTSDVTTLLRKPSAPRGLSEPRAGHA